MIRSRLSGPGKNPEKKKKAVSKEDARTCSRFNAEPVVDTIRLQDSLFYLNQNASDQESFQPSL